MVKVAVMGYGIVGSGFIEVLERNREILNRDIHITTILVKDIKKHSNKKYKSILTTDINEFFSKESDIVVEVMGGVSPTYKYVKMALKKGKHVVTANKDLLAEYGKELFELARKNKVSLKFEASVAGGITVIKPITESLRCSEIIEIKAILNGTTNYILTKMEREEVSYEEALDEAKALGFAEINPESDVEGYDSARKLAILSSLSYGKNVAWKEQLIEGITNIELIDFKYADMLNCKLKLVAHSKKYNNEIFSSVRPTLVGKSEVLSRIDDEYNIVILNGSGIGDVSYIGKGAGKLPTGNAVFSDVLDIIDNRTITEVLLQEEKATVSISDKEESNALIRFATNKKDYVLKRCEEEFIDFKVLSEDEEEKIAVFVKAKSEDNINKVIKTLKAGENIWDVKKIAKI